MNTPTILYAADGSTVLIDAVDIPEYLAKGYADTPDAFDHHPADLNESGEVTREEMEQKATELGLKFDGRTSNRKLLAMIEEAVK